MSTPKRRKLTITFKTSCKAGAEGASTSNADSRVSNFGNWRDNCKDVRQTYRYALQQKILTDVTFLVGPEGTVCHAHRLILALASPVFEAMFYGGLAENGETITIPDVTPEGFQHLLRFVYWEQTSFEDEMDAFQTIVAADKYCILNLKSCCEKYLETCPLTSANIWRFLENSVLLYAEKIKQRCLAYLKSHIEVAIEDSSFLEVSPKTVETLLRAETLSIKEYNLIINVACWAEHKCKAEKTGTISEILAPLLSLFRFASLNPSEFITFTEKYNTQKIIADNDALAILKYLCRSDLCSLPDWCCKEEHRCIKEEHRSSSSTKTGSKSNKLAISAGGSNSKSNNDSKKALENKALQKYVKRMSRGNVYNNSSTSSSSSDSDSSSTSDISTSSDFSSDEE